MNKHEFYFAWLQTVLHGLPRFKNYSSHPDGPSKIKRFLVIPGLFSTQLNYGRPRSERSDVVNSGLSWNGTQKFLESHKNGISCENPR